MTVVGDLDAVLPQTQCGLCGYAGCRPYAEAMAGGTATIGLCPPGGITTLHALGKVLGVDPASYESQIKQSHALPAVARIREEDCIGCTKCIQACPVDAILGAAKYMHTVLGDECTGCGLCVEPCPVDCIEMIAVPALQYHPDQARARYQARQIRLVAEEHTKVQQYRTKRRLSQTLADDSTEQAAKRSYILEALARVQAKK